MPYFFFLLVNPLNQNSDRKMYSVASLYTTNTQINELLLTVPNKDTILLLV